MGRPKFSEATRALVLQRPGNPHGTGRCWHCGVELTEQYHIDHSPVRYADIEGQIMCGVRDPREPDNLVPSCPACNVSHRHERTVWCGRSQCRWTMAHCLCTVVALLTLALTGVTAMWLSCL